jgi:hypothetical protein
MFSTAVAAFAVLTRGREPSGYINHERSALAEGPLIWNHTNEGKAVRERGTESKGEGPTLRRSADENLPSLSESCEEFWEGRA